MITIKCDYEGCEEERQVLDKTFPKDWLYIGDFEYCPKCSVKAQEELEDDNSEEWECSECGEVWESNIEPETNEDGEYICDGCE